MPAMVFIFKVKSGFALPRVSETRTLAAKPVCNLFARRARSYVLVIPRAAWRIATTNAASWTM